MLQPVINALRAARGQLQSSGIVPNESNFEDLASLREECEQITRTMIDMLMKNAVFGLNAKHPGICQLSFSVGDDDYIYIRAFESSGDFFPHEDVFIISEMFNKFAPPMLNGHEIREFFDGYRVNNSGQVFASEPSDSTPKARRPRQ